MKSTRMLGRSLRQMREDIMGIRLTPIGEIFARLPFVIQDLSRQSSKKVRLKIEGQETAVDKYLIEKLKGSFVAHGAECIQPWNRNRGRNGKPLSKPEEATIELSASTMGDFVIIKVRDDGRGINANAIIRRARKLGLEIPRRQITTPS